MLIVSELTALYQDRKSTCYWSSEQKWHFLPKVHRETPNSLDYVFLPPASPVLANIHSILAYDVPRTEDVDLPTKFRFTVGPTLQPIAGSKPVNRLQRWPNTNLSQVLLYTLRKHMAFTWFNQCCFNVDPQSSKLARHWNSIGWLYRVYWLMHYADDPSTSLRQKH